MKKTTFQARDMREALKEVKEKLGADAVILSTRSIREPGSGLTQGRTLIEVVACPSPNAKESLSVPSQTPASPWAAATAGREPTGERDRLAPAPGRFTRVVDDPIEYPAALPPLPPLPPLPLLPLPLPQQQQQQQQQQGKWDEVIGSVDAGARLGKPPVTAPGTMLAELGTVNPTDTVNPGLGGAADAVGLDAEGRRQYSWLLMHGVEEPIARQLAALDRTSKERGLAVAFQRALRFRDPLDSNTRVIALVGPTGVGKTTTLAKIAADLILNRQRSVGMITLDTFRVGAVAQLETYAKLLQVRLVVARSASDVKAGLHALSRCDYVLVDTVGSSPYNRRQVNSTAGMLPVMGEGREIILCMAANVREAEQLAIYRRFAILQPTGLIFTKLDETVTYGGILNVCIKANLPLTLYTDGQRVPENLGWMSANTLARWFEQDSQPEN